jgi:hypothetical protein
MIVLTSFKRADEYDMAKVSVARWQPKGEHYRSLDFLAAEAEDGKPLRLEECGENPTNRFAELYAGGLRARWREVRLWIDELDPKIDLCLICWCPFSKNSEEFFATTGSIACHNLLIGKLIKLHRKDIEVICDEDRIKYGQKEWMP